MNTSGRIGVEPEEPQAGPGPGAPQITISSPAPRDVRQAEIFRKHGMPRHVGEYAQAPLPTMTVGMIARAVQAVGQVHGIRRSDDHGKKSGAIKAHRAQLDRRHALKKRHDELVQRRHGARVEGEIGGSGKAEDRLPEKLGSRRKALRICGRRPCGSRPPSLCRRTRTVTSSTTHRKTIG